MRQILLSEELLQDLYLQKRMSVSEIAKVQKCSEHKINYWIRRYAIKKRTIADAMYLRHNPNGHPFSLKEIKNIADAKLMGLGLGLYWGEGNKKSRNSVRLGNTDPFLIKTFIRFLLQICGVKNEKLRFSLQIFSDLSPKEAFHFWLNNLKEFDIVKQQFSKITVTPARSIGTYREKSKYGVLTVYVHNSKLKNVIDQFVAEVAQRQSNSMVNSIAH